MFHKRLNVNSLTMEKKAKFQVRVNKSLFYNEAKHSKKCRELTFIVQINLIARVMLYRKPLVVFRNGLILQSEFFQETQIMKQNLKQIFMKR